MSKPKLHPFRLINNAETDPDFSQYHHLRRPITTWISNAEYDLFQSICKSHGVTGAAYLRAVLIDVIAEEGPKVKTLFTQTLES